MLLCKIGRTKLFGQRLFVIFKVNNGAKRYEASPIALLQNQIDLLSELLNQVGNLLRAIFADAMIPLFSSQRLWLMLDYWWSSL